MLRQRSPQEQPLHFREGENPASNGQQRLSPRGSSSDEPFQDNGLHVAPLPFHVQPDGERGKIALVLAGGGVTGVVYEIGALRAIDDLLVGLSVNDFDIYVGTSAGALVSSLVANGLTPREVMQVLDSRHPELRNFRAGDVFRINFEDVVDRVLRVPRILYSIFHNTVGHLNDIALFDILWDLTGLLPNGMYNGDALDHYMRSILERPGRTNSFSQLERELFIVASELDNGKRAVFGRKHMEDVSISRAVAASSAVPVLYRPVQVAEKDYLDGSLHGNASIDLAIEAGAKLIVCINPMVPFDASQVRPHEHYIRKNGLQAIINQSVRTLLHSSLHYHIKNLRAKYPDVDIILIQPTLDDLEMFSYNPMHYAGRLGVAEHAFESVTTGLLSNLSYYQGILSRHNIELHTDLVTAELRVLQSERRSTQMAEEVIEPPRRTLSSVVSHLEINLRRLESVVNRMEGKVEARQA